MTFAKIREFKLGKSGCCRIHPYLNGDGAFFGNDAPLLEKDAAGRWRPRPRAALERDLSKALGASIDLDWRMDSFTTVARALNKGDRSLAAIALVHAELPSLPAATPRMELRQTRILEKMRTMFTAKRASPPVKSVLGDG